MFSADERPHFSAAVPACYAPATMKWTGAIAVAVIIAGLAAFAAAPRAEAGGPLQFSVSFPAARSPEPGNVPLDGRVLLFVSDDLRVEFESGRSQVKLAVVR